MRPLRLAILVSGRGSNLEAILEARPPGIEPVLVISNRSSVRALEVAARHGVPTRVMRRADFAEAGARDAAIGNALTEVGAHLALLAGYDQVLAPPYFAGFGGRTINIHPSLLPVHGGPGMVGLAVHREVLAAGERETGVTIHEVTPELDAGPIIAQSTVAVRPGDDATRLAGRVLDEEHRLLVRTLTALAAEARAGTSSATMAAAPASIGAGPPQETPHA
jgi:phosphoribosylglycinamide formyltransferase-1